MLSTNPSAAAAADVPQIPQLLITLPISFSIVYVVLCECSQRTVVENLHSVVEETISHRDYFSIILFLLSRNYTSSSHS